MCFVACNGQTEHTHNFGEWSIIKNETCTEGGVKTCYCDCGEKQSDIIPAAGHIEVIIPAIEPTYTETGFTEGKCCGVCGVILVEQTVVEYNYENLESGLYDEEDQIIATWEELVNQYGMDVTLRYSVMPGSENYYLTTVTAPYYVLTNNENLAAGVKLVIDDSVTSIEYAAFYKCNFLESIVIPDSVTFINLEAFSYCTALESVNIPYGTVFLKRNAFVGCTALKSIEIPNTVIRIDDFAFGDCASLEKVVIPDSITAIGRYAFYNCSSLKEITIAESVTSIGEGAFWGCTMLETIVFEGTVGQWNDIVFIKDDGGFEWNYYVPATTIICNDGIVQLTLQIPDTSTILSSEIFIFTNEDLSNCTDCVLEIDISSYKFLLLNITFFDDIEYDPSWTDIAVSTESLPLDIPVSYIDPTDTLSVTSDNLGDYVNKILDVSNYKTFTIIISTYDGSEDF